MGIIAFHAALEIGKDGVLKIHLRGNNRSMIFSQNYYARKVHTFARFLWVDK